MSIGPPSSDRLAQAQLESWLHRLNGELRNLSGRFHQLEQAILETDQRVAALVEALKREDEQTTEGKERSA